MSNHYRSFLIRCWHVQGDEQRIKVEHIQSGEQALLTTSAAALAWMCARSDNTTVQPPLTSDQAGTPLGLKRKEPPTIDDLASAHDE